MRADCSSLTPCEFKDITNMYYETANQAYQLMEMLDTKMNEMELVSVHQTRAAPHTTASSAREVRDRVSGATHRLVDWVGNKAVHFANTILPGNGHQYEKIIHSGEEVTGKIADTILDRGLEGISELTSHHVHASPELVDWVGDQAVNMTNYFSPGMGDQFGSAIHGGVAMAERAAEYVVNAGLDTISGLLSRDHSTLQRSFNTEPLNQQLQTGPQKTQYGLSHGDTIGCPQGGYGSNLSNTQYEMSRSTYNVSQFGEMEEEVRQYLKEVDYLLNVFQKCLF